jgi:2-keto-4-pentenoate hydratase/2-oxohepta-3-ene-1,7-dioic acid hydratase in catechol pathway
MRFCRYKTDNTTRYGLIEDVRGVPTIVRSLPWFPHAFANFERGETTEIAVDQVRLLAPVEPSKVVCIGRNYREHAKELNHAIPTEPLFFLKPPSSVIASGDEIRRPGSLSQRVDYEGELGVVIGKACYQLGEDQDVRPYILGYTCVNDVTARDLQNKDGQWSRAKGFDTFCPVGPVVADGLDPWSGVRVQTRVNGELRQDGTTSDFLFPLDRLLRHICQVMTLLPGDLVATGTPSGVGSVVAGDRVEVTVEGIGTLSNPVVERD